jgi:hypothetical protein
MYKNSDSSMLDKVKHHLACLRISRNLKLIALHIMPSIAAADLPSQAPITSKQAQLCPITQMDFSTAEKLKADPIYCRSCYPEFEMGYIDALDARRTGLYVPHNTVEYGLRLKLHQVGSKGSPSCEGPGIPTGCPALQGPETKAGQFAKMFSSRL